MLEDRRCVRAIALLGVPPTSDMDDDKAALLALKASIPGFDLVLSNVSGQWSQDAWLPCFEGHVWDHVNCTGGVVTSLNFSSVPLNGEWTLEPLPSAQQHH